MKGFNPLILGDYIHLRKQNYEKFGIGDSSADRNASYYGVLQTNRQKYLEKRGIRKTDSKLQNAVEELNVRLENEFNNKSQTLDDNTIVSRQMIYDAISYLFQTMYFDLDGKLKAKTKEDGKSREYYNNKFKAGYNKFKKSLKNIQEKNSIQGTENEVINNIQNLSAEYADAMQFLLDDNDFKNNYITSNKVSAQQILNKYLSYVGNTAIKTTIAGSWGEHFIALLGDEARSRAKDNLKDWIDDYFKKSVIGGQGSTIKVDYEDFGGSNEVINDESDEKYIINQYLKTQFTTKKTQDKTDVTITIDQQPLNISVKTYSSNTPTLQKDIRMDLVLAYFNKIQTQPRFLGNHWLNIENANPNDPGLIITKYKDNVPLPNASGVEELLQTELEIEALVKGNPYKNIDTSKDTNVFVFMNYKTGKFYAHTAYSILTEHEKLFNISKAIETTKKIANWEEWKKHNISGDDAAKNRILDILHYYGTQRRTVHLRLSQELANSKK